MGAERIKELTETGKAVPSARPHRFKNLERPLAPVGRQGRAGRALMRQHKPDHRQEPDESHNHHRDEQHAHDHTCSAARNHPTPWLFASPLDCGCGAPKRWNYGDSALN